MIKLKQELESGKRESEHEKLYEKYFTIKTTSVRGTKAQVREEVIANIRRYYGFFALITNETMDAVTALELYRNKDVVEKAFGNVKERLNMRRTLVSSEQSLDGKLFVMFVALIYLSYIKKQMQVEGSSQGLHIAWFVGQVRCDRVLRAAGANTAGGRAT